MCLQVPNSVGLSGFQLPTTEYVLEIQDPRRTNCGRRSCGLGGDVEPYGKLVITWRGVIDHKAGTAITPGSLLASNSNSTSSPSPPVAFSHR